jgi:hypothetical protein
MSRKYIYKKGRFMDSKSFVKVMRKLISEEVRKAVRAEMRTLLKEQKTDHRKSMKHGMQMYQETSAPKVSKKKSKPFTKDSILNDILNETAETLAPGELYSSQPMVSQERSLSFGSNDAQGFGMMRQHAMQPVTDINNNPADTSNEKVAAVVDNITKDYSALMSAIDKKKGL